MDINTYLIKNNMSQYMLSKRSGVPYSTISDICSHKTDITKCNVLTVAKIAETLKTSIESLIEQKDNKIAEFEGSSLTIKQYYKKRMRNRKNVILFGTSALDYLNMTNSAIGLQIEVYATSILPPPFKTHLVKNFKNIKYDVIEGVMVSNFDQAINDALSDTASDLQALDEALNKYYYLNNKSFKGIAIKKKNIETFKKECKLALKYYES